jgi:hypothetical protein
MRGSSDHPRLTLRTAAAALSKRGELGGAGLLLLLLMLLPSGCRGGNCCGAPAGGV